MVVQPALMLFRDQEQEDRGSGRNIGR